MTRKSRARVFAFAAIAGLIGCAVAPLRAADDADHVSVELISEHMALAPGQSQQLGILLKHEPHWHTYWINPGDSGLPTTLAWTLPPGVETQDVAWPMPKRFEVGGLYNFGYDGEVVLPVAISVAADAVPGSKAHIAVDAKWLVCREECIPGRKTLALDLPIATKDNPPKPDGRWTMQFSRVRLAEPQATAWKATNAAEGDRVVVTLRGPGLPAASGLDAFVAQRKLVDNKPPHIKTEGDALIVDFGKSEYFGTPPETFDLVLTQPSAAGLRGWRVQVPFAAKAAP